MHVVTVAHEGTDRVGVVDGDVVRLMPVGTTLLGLLGDDGERLHAAGQAALAAPHGEVRFDAAALRAPLPVPPTIRDFMTFERHVEGVARLMGDGSVGPEWYELPVFYFGNPYAVVGPYDDVPVPPGSEVLDFELEVAAVIGRDGYNLAPDDAERHIVGYLVLNDWSARDVQGREMRAHLGPAKGKDTATTLGPALVTADELEPYRSGPSFALGMTARINGRVFGTDRLDNMAWSFGELVSYASRGTWVRAGDVLGSGTCANGCLAEAWGRHGRGHVPPLQPGDVVELEVDVLGTLRNRIVAGAPLHPLAPRAAAVLAGDPS